MNRVQQAFTRDLGRKILALALALLVWWRVHLGILVTEQVNFVMATAEHPSNAGHTIEIDVPSGWKLVSPSPGSTQQINLRGVNVDLQSFRQAGIDASFTITEAMARELESSGSFGVDVELVNLEWFDPSQALPLINRANEKGAENKALRLSLERIREESHVLTIDSLELAGNVASGHVPEFDEIEFNPSSVRLSGPINAMDEYVGNPENWKSLFEPINLTDHKAQIRARLRLSQAASQAGLTMPDEAVELRLPVYPVGLNPFDITPIPENIAIVGEPPTAGERWLARAYTGTGFRVSYRHHPDIDPMPDAGTLRDSIVFFVHLAELPSGALDGQLLPVNWAIRDPVGALGDSKRLQALKHAITLVPLSEDLGTDLILQKLE